MRTPGLSTLLLPLALLVGCSTPVPTNTPRPASAVGPASAPSTANPKAVLSEARRLGREKQFPAARRLYEQYLAQCPNDADAHFWFGFDLCLQAGITEIDSDARALRRQAREQMLQAEKLGCTEPLLADTLPKLKPDGSALPVAPFSPAKSVDALMQSAEKAYATGNYSEAAKLHQQALAIEPGNYSAALYCGDAYFCQKDYATAGVWFAKAIAINPDVETAHRYWADALAHQRRNDEALTQYIEAVVAAPYNRLTRARFNDFAKATLVPLRTEPLRLPPGGFAQGRQTRNSDGSQCRGIRQCARAGLRRHLRQGAR
jgi:tetratricopeptide (TPR) repeat protein